MGFRHGNRLGLPRPRLPDTCSNWTKAYEKDYCISYISKPMIGFGHCSLAGVTRKTLEEFYKSKHVKLWTRHSRLYCNIVKYLIPRIGVSISRQVLPYVLVCVHINVSGNKATKFRYPGDRLARQLPSFPEC